MLQVCRLGVMFNPVLFVLECSSCQTERSALSASNLEEASSVMRRLDFSV